MWILIVYIYAGMMASGDSVALIQVHDTTYQTEQACKQQGKKLESLVRGSTKELRISCIKTE